MSSRCPGSSRRSPHRDRRNPRTKGRSGRAGSDRTRRTRRIRAHRRIRRILVDDVGVRSPAAQVVREEHVRREVVTQLRATLREAAASADLPRLLEIAPEIGLDVHHDRLRAVHALEEQLHVAPVRRHRRSHPACSSGPRAPRRRRPASTARHVVAEHRRCHATTSPGRTSSERAAGFHVDQPWPVFTPRRGTGSGSQTAPPCATRPLRRVVADADLQRGGQCAGSGGSGEEAALEAAAGHERSSHNGERSR